MTDCCTSIKVLDCKYSCDLIQIGEVTPVTGVYTIEIQPDTIQIVQTTNTISTPMIFSGGYLNEDATTVFKIIKPDGTYFTASGGEDCFQITIKPAFDPTLADVVVDPVTCADATYQNSDSSFTHDIASGDTYTAPDITLTEVDSSTTTYPANKNISCDASLCPKTVELYFAFTASTDTSALATNGGTTWTLTAISDDGSSGTITVSVNGGAYAAFSNPTTITNAQTIQVKRTTTTAAGWVLITGTYA